MKQFKKISYVAAAIMIAAALMFAYSCRKEERVPSNPASPTAAMGGIDARMANSAAYSPTSSPFGRSMGQWGAEWWKWTYHFNCGHNPLLDTTGAYQNQDQQGPVFFLGGGEFNTPVVRNVNVSDNKSLFFSLISEIYDYPNPNDTSYHPAPGQSLYNFLIMGVEGDISQINILSATLDGANISTNLYNNLAHSNLFNFIGNPDIANCIDNFVDGKVQQGVTDGYWMMLKPLNPGNHTLHFTGGLAATQYHPLLLMDLTYNLRVTKDGDDDGQNGNNNH